MGPVAQLQKMFAKTRVVATIGMNRYIPIDSQLKILIIYGIS